MKRVVVDTNILISAIFWRGIPGAVIDVFTQNRAFMVLSLPIIAELERKLSAPKFALRITAIGRAPSEIANDFRELAEIVTPAEIPESAVRDAKDRIILAAAVGGQANYIVSGDKDLTDMGMYAGISILTPLALLAHINAATE
jgi:putative PIN family toxin of toxin-antitoxin system